MRVKARGLWPVNPWSVTYDERKPKITGGNAEVAENKALTEKATHKLMQRKGLQIDRGAEARFADREAGITGQDCR